MVRDTWHSEPSRSFSWVPRAASPLRWGLHPVPLTAPPLCPQASRGPCHRISLSLFQCVLNVKTPISLHNLYLIRGSHPQPCSSVLWVKSLSRVRFFATPWTIASQAPLSMGFSRQEYWSGLPFPSPGDLSNPGIKPRSPALQADTLFSKPTGKFFPNAILYTLWSCQTPFWCLSPISDIRAGASHLQETKSGSLIIWLKSQPQPHSSTKDAQVDLVLRGWTSKLPHKIPASKSSPSGWILGLVLGSQSHGMGDQCFHWKFFIWVKHLVLKEADYYILVPLSKLPFNILFELYFLMPFFIVYLKIFKMFSYCGKSHII